MALDKQEVTFFIAALQAQKDQLDKQYGDLKKTGQSIIESSKALYNEVDDPTGELEKSIYTLEDRVLKLQETKSDLDQYLNNLYWIRDNLFTERG